MHIRSIARHLQAIDTSFTLRFTLRLRLRLGAREHGMLATLGTVLPAPCRLLPPR